MTDMLPGTKIEMLILNKYENTVMHSNAKEALEDMSSEISDKPLIVTIRKSIIASVVSALVLLLMFAGTAKAAFQYEHDPMQNSDAAADIIVNRTLFTGILQTRIPEV